MKLWNTQKKIFEEGNIELISKEDYSKVRKSDQFQFDWNKEKANLVFKIYRKNEEEILGLISLIDIPRELRVEIHLLEISKDNIGKNKIIDRLAGCLIAHACNLAFQKDYDGFVSLISKTEIVKLYKEKYGFQEMGNHLCSQLHNSDSLINEYLNDAK